MTTYVDTSALYAVLDADDRNHGAAREAWIDLARRREPLLCSNYVLLETFALTRHRLGTAAVRCLQEDVVPVLAVRWVDESVHEVGVHTLLTAGRARLSLVDCVSFAIMRQLGIRSVFAFDPHFEQQGFQPVPA